MSKIKKHLIFILILLCFFILSKLLTSNGFENTPTNMMILNQVKLFCTQLISIFQSHPIIFLVIYFLSFLILTICFIPFTASTYVLFTGAIFGFYKGIIIFSFLISICYTASFLIAKYLLQKRIRKKLSKKGNAILNGFEQDGVLYLLSIRFSGVIPAVLVNTIMGLTKISTAKFYFVTQIGTLPHVIMMIYVGSQILILKDINSIHIEKFIPIIFILAFMPTIIEILFLILSKKIREKKSSS